MELEAYLSRPDALSPTDLAKVIGVSKGRLSQLRKETREGREWPPELALKAETATAGQLSASALSSIIAQARAS